MIQFCRCNLDIPLMTATKLEVTFQNCHSQINGFPSTHRVDKILMEMCFFNVFARKYFINNFGT